ncbi:hypothetical protein AX16_007848 [Volvariella volvacea WC 439]|nr:hypothetical protein AX16_007848 [Volvariella volvacea WC 439]
MSSPPSNTGRNGLFPGYKHVDSFGPAEEYEGDEEVTYVTLDLGDIEPTLVPSSNTYRLIGLDTPTPFLQLSGTILKGRHESLLGTELLFTDDPDERDWNKRGVKHVANTEQRICFKEVQLQAKTQPETSPMDEDEVEGGAPNDHREQATDEAESPAAAAVSVVDRVTGKDASKPARRKRKGKAKGKAKDKGTSGSGPAASHVEVDGGTSNELGDVSMADVGQQ